MCPEPTWTWVLIVIFLYGLSQDNGLQLGNPQGWPSTAAEWSPQAHPACPFWGLLRVSCWENMYIERFLKLSAIH